ncbi:hypothetical protein EDC01DRAFT_781162 [Geopyxis carbonaria]|nr:hypothetical protein EDC01DRAFT_781162 [Geopyxis carbonaria]
MSAPYRAYQTRYPYPQRRHGRGRGYHYRSNYYRGNYYQGEPTKMSQPYHNARTATADEYFEGASEVKIREGPEGYKKSPLSKDVKVKRENGEWEVLRGEKEENERIQETPTERGEACEEEAQEMISPESYSSNMEKKESRQHEETRVKEVIYGSPKYLQINKEHESPREYSDDCSPMAEAPASPLDNYELPPSLAEDTALFSDLNSYIEQQSAQLATIMPKLYAQLEELLAKQDVFYDLEYRYGASWNQLNQIREDFKKIADEKEKLEKEERENARQEELGGRKKAVQMAQTGNFRKTKVYTCATKGPAAGIGSVYWV